MRPESWGELTTYLNGLSAATWKAILVCNHIGGDARVIRYLRNECRDELKSWSDEELGEYLETCDIRHDFLSVDARW